MDKEQLITKITERTGLKKIEVSNIINIFITEVKDKLDRGEKVEIEGFGNFMLTPKDKEN